MNLKPFDLEAALRGVKVVDNLGNEIVEIVFLREVNTNICPNCVIAVTKEGISMGYNIKGTNGFKTLFMAPRVKTCYINIYKGHNFFEGNLYDNEECIELEKKRNREYKFIKTISFEIEE